jgi:hypothetical protein
MTPTKEWVNKLDIIKSVQTCIDYVVTNYPDTPCHYFSMLRLSGEANSNFIVFSKSLIGKWIELTIYGTRGEQTNHYTSETVTNVSNEDM